ncbi:MAG: 50S ribosomal protein L11 methyltransferase [Candidatus Kapabacteria bacterium]|nr:50S ribosomal protein L11 methyltransferase [Candidatus Kapabacteria bacterium]
MIKKYINAKISIHEEYFDLSMSVFQDYDFCGIEEGNDELIITFEESVFNNLSIDSIVNELKNFDHSTSLISIEKISDKNWNEEWENNIQPVVISDRIVITPTHKAEETESEIKIIIDPKMSFGTGHHTTTRLMCRLMEDLVKKDSYWIDAGTGTGVLAILAVKLGAAKVYAFDNDEWSIDNSKENIIKNNVYESIRLELANIDSIEIEKCDGISANIFLNLALPSLKKFKNAVRDSDGDILISGIMIYDDKILIAEAEKQGLKLIKKVTEDEWAAFHFRCGDEK